MKRTLENLPVDIQKIIYKKTKPSALSALSKTNKNMRSFFFENPNILHTGNVQWSELEQTDKLNKVLTPIPHTNTGVLFNSENKSLEVYSFNDTKIASIPTSLDRCDSKNIIPINSELIITTTSGRMRVCSLWSIRNNQCLAQIEINYRNRKILCDGKNLYIVNPKEIYHALINELNPGVIKEDSLQKIYSCPNAHETYRGFTYLIPDQYLVIRLVDRSGGSDVRVKMHYVALSLTPELNNVHLQHVVEHGEIPISTQLKDGTLLYCSDKSLFKFKDGVESKTNIPMPHLNCDSYGMIDSFKLFPVDNTHIAMLKNHHTRSGDIIDNFHGSNITIFDIKQSNPIATKHIKNEVNQLLFFDHGAALVTTYNTIACYEAPFKHGLGFSQNNHA